MTTPALEHLDVHYRRLEAEIGGDQDTARAMVRQAAEIEAEVEVSEALPLLRLASRLGVDPTSRDLVLLAASPALAPSTSRRLGVSGPRWTRRDLLAAFGDGAQSHLCPRLLDGAPLFASGLLAAAGDAAQPDALDVPPHWLGFLCGVRLTGVPEHIAARIVPDVVADQLVVDPDVWRNLEWLGRRLLDEAPDEPLAHPETLELPNGFAVLLAGEPGTGRTLLAKALCTTWQRAILRVEGRLLATAPDRVRLAARLVEQAQLFEEVLLVRDADVLLQAAPEVGAALCREVSSRRVLLLCTCVDPGPVDTFLDPVLAFRTVLAPLDSERRGALYPVNAPGGLVLAPDVDLRRLARHPLTGRQVGRTLALVSRLAAPRADGTPGDVSHAMIEACIDRQAAVRRKAERTPEVAFGLDHLVLSAETLAQVRQVIEAVRVRRTVLEEWGFRRAVHRGVGVVCLFDGDPGTGKTLTAEVLARETGLTLRIVNTSSIVDKYIGETEKNLTRLFEQTDPQREVLLFDEADALFAKRTEVSRSTDRYSNMEINALLQLIERYDGVVMMTTNLKDRIDPAFERRIMFKVSFPMPDEAMRALLWQRHLPPTAPVAADVDVTALARRYPLAGGAIKNAALRAAYAAASAGVAIEQRHLAEAARHEAVAAGQLVRDG